MIFNKKYKIIFGIIIALILGVGFLFAYINGVFTPLIEKVINESPEAKISAYIQAINKGDRETAFNLWERPVLNAPSEYVILVKERKEKAFNNFVNMKINSDFKIISTEWWTTCCTPNITNNPKDAGRAVVKVELNINNEKRIYIFNMIVKGENYAGEAEGYPVRHWGIGDIYLLGDKPLS